MSKAINPGFDDIADFIFGDIDIEVSGIDIKGNEIYSAANGIAVVDPSFQATIIDITGNNISDSIDVITQNFLSYRNTIILNKGEISKKRISRSNAVNIRNRENSLIEAYIRNNIMDEAEFGIFLETSSFIGPEINRITGIDAVVEDNQFGDDINIELVGRGRKSGSFFFRKGITW